MVCSFPNHAFFKRFSAVFRGRCYPATSHYSKGPSPLSMLKKLFLSDFLVLTFFLKALPTVSALILANHPEYLQLSYLRPWKLAMQKRNTCLQKIHLLSVRQSGGIDSHTRPCYTGRNSTNFCKGRFFYGA